MNYNGYVNYETWVVSLWLDNNHFSSEMYTDLARRLLEDDIDPRSARYELGKVIKENMEEFNPLGDDASMYSDLLSASLRSVH